MKAIKENLELIVFALVFLVMAITMINMHDQIVYLDTRNEELHLENMKLQAHLDVIITRPESEQQLVELPNGNWIRM